MVHKYVPQLSYPFICRWTSMFFPCPSYDKQRSGGFLTTRSPGEKEMAAHSSILAWRILWTEEPGGLPSMGSQRVGHDWSDLAAAADHQGSPVSFFYT